MIVQTIHEILNPFDVEVDKLGYGVALFLIAGSIHSNPQFIVRMYTTGEMRTVDQNSLRVYGNPSSGEPLSPQTDITPSDVACSNCKCKDMIMEDDSIYCSNCKRYIMSL
jgi:hypothetical protein